MLTTQQLTEYAEERFKETRVIDLDIESGVILLVNEAIAVPEAYLISADGRLFEVIEWCPRAAMGEIVSVTCKFNIRIGKT